MWQIVETTELVRHGMNISQTGVVEGHTRQSTMAILTWLEVLVMMVNRVISLAVPAVVLMAI
jgi:K+-sensing histidine kinase KdpD